MPATRADLFARLDALGIAHETYDHAPVFTVEEAEAETGHVPGLHVKNLFLKDKRGDLWLATVAADRRVDLKHLQALLGAGRFSFGKPDLLMEVLGVTPGSVTPFALINDPDRRVVFALDRRVAEAERINAHPLFNDASTVVTGEGLKRFVSSFGHDVRIVDLDTPA
ncbi:prolyl-tRNA synthetase associated domain-containing protein [uncultured Tistrella sp.]|uniref:prolyl-tRNA synthetase associated domain-containing protein n=1 Tax=Tistrella mobilis TaxID=171437 RepID=UPI000C0A062A|nr:prolyl-tRNA synthetase associated domain-containing protein [uncultured Tistrella sp.]MAM74997.1 DNA-binding protein [Tistrella sp.]|tara:strand:+ start:39 stop:539 length:501 start_codon:yes stop_codon:yes gene_type:complete